MTRLLLLFVPLLLCSFYLFAAPPSITPHIKIDQFGYLPASKKIAVIVDPQTGYNAAQSFNPGTGANNYQVRRWSDDAVVFSGTLTVWNGGATHAQSGDRGWWFDFSAVTAPGSYYVFDVANNVGSFRFEIGNTVYTEVLKHAVRVFFYQRINFAKTTAYTDAKWADGAAFEGANQDRAARSRYDKTNPATAKDLHGGWMDAGDYNKYTTFTIAPLCHLLETYRLYPTVFADNYGIPESGNGIPDLLDEVKWELDWLKRMQDASGNGGLYLKLGADNFNAASPPSTDANPRYYLGECTSATLTGAAVFSLASIAFRQTGNPALITYADDLLARAQQAWNRAVTTTSNFTSFQTACDDGDIKAGDADAGVADQRDRAITAAAYLYEATGLLTYKTAFENMYTAAQPYANWWWGPYYSPVQRALLRYARLPGATATVSNNIISMKGGQNGVMSITDYTAATDLYRAFVPDDQYHWGNSQVKADAGVHNWDFASFDVNTGQKALYKEVAEQYLHWFHGVNPMGKVLLSNMYAAGGDDCANEIYHAWFANGTDWDNALASSKGPAPGYVVGGPNRNYAVAAVNPPYGQPPQKSYKDWNTVWNGSFSEDSWEITEPAIYYQASYIALLVRVMGNLGAVTLPVRFLDFSAKRNAQQVLLHWKIETTETIDHFEVERSCDGQAFQKIADVNPIAGKGYDCIDNNPAFSGICSYRIKTVMANGGVEYSKVIRLPVAAANKFLIAPNPVQNETQVQINLAQAATVRFLLMNTQSQVVLKQQWKLATGATVKTVSLAGLPAGVYEATLTVGDHTERIRIVKQ